MYKTRQERRYHTHLIQQKRLKQAELDNANLSNSGLGRLRNHSYYDCGKTRCFVCHSPKLSGTPSHYMDKLDLYSLESLKDFWEN